MLTEGHLPMPVSPAEHAMHQTALVSVRGRLDCAVDPLYLPSKDDLGQRAQMLSGRASMTESPVLQTMTLYHGTCVTGSRITMPVL